MKRYYKKTLNLPGVRNVVVVKFAEAVGDIDARRVMLLAELQTGSVRQPRNKLVAVSHLD